VLEREVKKANREMNNSLSKMDDLTKIDTLQKRVTEHLADMKRLERDNLKNKKRGDMLQKEKDHGRAELSKSVGLKEKLEKLCRELQKENNRLKVDNSNQEAEWEMLMKGLGREQDLAGWREIKSTSLGPEISADFVSVTGPPGCKGESTSSGSQYRGWWTVGYPSY